jgi:hypothetical protein
VEGEEEVNTAERTLYLAGASHNYIYKLRRKHPDHEWTAEEQSDGKSTIYVTLDLTSTDDPWCPRRRGPSPDPRLPAEPLLRQLELRFPGEATEAALADWIGAHRSTIRRWKAEGILFPVAERHAEALDLHVLNIWPDAYGDLDREGAPMWVLDTEEEAA